MIKTLVNRTLKLMGWRISRIGILPDDLFSIIAARQIDHRNKSETPVVIQVGANDGVSNDPIHDLLASRRIKAVLIEPQPEAFRRLKNTYKDKNYVYENASISRCKGTTTLYRIKEEKSAELKRLYKKTANSSGVASFDREHVKKFLVRALGNSIIEIDVDSWIEEISTSTIDFQYLIDEHEISNVDILQIDAEGYDDVILFMALADFHEDPAVVNLEVKNISKERRIRVEKELTKRAYSTFKHKGDLCGFKRVRI